MRNYGYKIILFAKNIYQEVELPYGFRDTVRIGTSRDCSLRFSSDLFGCDFLIEVEWVKDSWQINSHSGVYFTRDNIMKQFSLPLKHGDDLSVKYQGTDAELFKLSFSYHFDSIITKYNLFVSLKGRDSIRIGGSSSCDIIIDDSLVKEEYITLKKTGGAYQLIENEAGYTVMVNGNRIRGSAPVADYDFFMIAGYSFYLKDEGLYTENYQNVRYSNLQTALLQEGSNVFEYPHFNRTTRIHYKLPEEKLEVLDPPAKQEKPKQNIVLTLVPVAVSLILVIIFRGIMGSGNAFAFYSIAMMAMGAIMTVINLISERKRFQKEEEKRQKDYRAYISEKEQYITQLRQTEKERLELNFPSLKQELDFVKDFHQRLFERTPADEDFLHVRYGTGRVISNCQIEYKKHEFKISDDALMEIPEQLFHKFRYIDSAPIVSDWRQANAIGIVGSPARQYDFLKTLTMDLAIRHFYKDVKLIYVANKDYHDQLAWMRWLQNTWVEHNDMRGILTSEEAKTVFFEFLYSELSKRDEIEDKESFLPHYVVFVLDADKLLRHPIMNYLDRCAELGFTFVFFQQHEELLPIGCKDILRLKEGNQAELLKSEDGSELTELLYDTPEEQKAKEAALKLGCVTVDEVNLEGALTKNISLYKLLGIMNVKDLNLSERWSRSFVYKTMAAPIGVKAGDEVISLDLNEKAHGPHGLVAGTTGSGKSEILQTYILSMATLYHPYEVGFVIIDFKGGGMVNQFKNLPHLIGAITNIDGREIDRSLKSIKAELLKRQELFTQVNVNHIDAYIKKFKNGECSQALPHLILIVDEFAELKSEQPEFMKELISAARIGRSLGVHLILATQKPSGVVDEQIWSNSKFRLCLKVQNREDSKEVLKSPLAAEIKEPGRAYLQVGNNEIFELFQSAYSGAMVSSEEIGNINPFVINTVDLSGRRTLVYEQKAVKAAAGSTQLEAIVDYISQFCEEAGIQRLAGICLAPLPDLIKFTDRKKGKVDSKDILVPLGIYDDPSHQLQDEVLLNITQNNTFILGASQYGKTNILQTMIRSLATDYSPGEVNIYILDFASLILKNFEGLNHVGGVVTPNEDEKLKNFIKMILGEIEMRKELLARLGVSSFSAYKEAGYSELPQIILMVDNFIAFREIASAYDDSMLYICREGVSLGISVVLTSSQTSGIGYKYMSNFSRRIALFCNDSGEYNNLFERCRMQPRDRVGSGLIELNRTIYEYQNYLSFEGEKEIDRVSGMRSFIAEQNELHSGKKAKGIPEIPPLLTEQHLADRYPAPRQSYLINAGLDFESVALWQLDLMKMGLLSIAGRAGGGKKNFLRIIMNYFKKHLFDAPSRVYILDDYDRKLKDFDSYGFTSLYSIDANDIDMLLHEVNDIAEERYVLMSQKGPEGLGEEPFILLLIKNKEVISKISQNKELLELFKKLVGKAGSFKLGFIIYHPDNAPISYGSPEVLKMLKENKNALIFDNLSNQKIFEIPIAVSKQYKKEISAGDAYYLKENDIFKIKTVHMTD